jgi:hypothetical protein
MSECVEMAVRTGVNTAGLSPARSVTRQALTVLGRAAGRLQTVRMAADPRTTDDRRERSAP